MECRARYLVFLVFLAFRLGNTQEFCTVNQCPESEVCYNRVSSVVTDPQFVCECDEPAEMGYDCQTLSLTQAIFTCYGSSCLTGEFSSPNYPSAYSARYSALYMLYVPDATRIDFTFDTPFEIEPLKDELYVGRGLEYTSDQLNSQTVIGDKYYFEGTSVPSSFSLETDTAWLYFATDKNVQLSGFRIRWTSIVDTTAPTVINCPSNIFTTVQLGTTSTSVSWVTPTATDASGIASSTQTASPGSAFPVGTTTVTYTFTDTFNNVAFCQFTVTVSAVDTVPPVISNCPGVIIRVVELGMTGLSVSWTEPTATDTSGVAILTGRTAAPGDFFNVGTTNVIYTFADGSGNSNECSFVINVVTEDTTPPTIQNCPANIQRTVELGTSGTSVSWVEPTATDISGTVNLVTRSTAPNSFFNIGQSTVTYIFEDGDGNSATCSFVVSVVTVDTTPPSIENCPANIQRVVELGTSSIGVSWIEPTATDLSGTTLTGRSVTPGSDFSIGNTVVTYIFSDGAGNPSSCSFTVTVTTQDTMDPIIANCPANVLRNIELGTPNTAVTWVEPTASDISGSVTLTTRSHAPGSVFPVGTTTVVYTFTDPAGNDATCAFSITVTTSDTTPPTVLNCPNNQGTIVELGQSGATVTWEEPTAIDSSGTAMLTTRSAIPGSFFPVGETEVRYTFADNTGNSADCVFSVIVTTVDTTPPTVQNCPGDMLRNVELGISGTIVSWVEPSAIDASGTVTVQSRSHAPGTQFPVGSTVVTYVFVDGAGLTTTCQFTVTISPVDTTPPTLQNCPSNIARTIELGTSSTSVSWVEPTASDLSGLVTLQSRSHVPGSEFGLGTTVVTYVFVDNSNNEVMCTFTVTVNAEDTIPPTISNCPNNINRNVELGITGTSVSWTEPTATDASGVATLSLRSAAPGTFFPVGQTTVTYMFVDGSTNERLCTFVITVTTTDTTPPTISNCPADRSASVEVGTSNGAVVTWVEPTASDISGEVNLVSRSHAPGSTFPLGSTQVTYTFSDVNGNVNECVFTVTVVPVDTTNPVITGCPQNINVQVELGSSTSSSISWVEPVATDLSGSVTLVSRSHAPGSSFPLGETSVTYIFRDDSNNIASCTFTVFVTPVDTTPPTISNCPTNILRTVELGGSVVVDWVEPSATDISGTMNLVSRSHVPGTVFPVGTTQVVYVFQDASGNENSCSFSVTISSVDTIPPTVLNCPANLNRVVELGTGGANAEWTEPTSTDASGTQSLVSRSATPGSFFPVGTTEVVYVFRDASGNENECRFDVIVTPVDTIPPSIMNCPADISRAIQLGSTSAVVSWEEPTATDVSGVANVVARSFAPGSNFPIGGTRVTYTFADGSNNPSTCEFDITVTTFDSIPPTIENCPSNIARVVELGVTSVALTWVEPSASDISGVVNLVQRTSTPGSVFPVGSSTVVYTFEDGSGNPSSCSFVVTVTTQDTTPPTIMNCPTNVFQTIETGTAGTTITWVEPTSTDVSGTQSLQTRSSTPGSFFPVGSTTVTYVFSDASGNEATCQFSVTIGEVDTIPPTIMNCPGDIVVETVINTGGEVATWVQPTATDNSGTAFLSNINIESGSTFPVGTTEVRIDFSDPSGNPSSCTFTVTVVETDPEPPVLTSCPSNIERTVELGTANIIAAYQLPTAVDNSGVVNLISQSHNSGDSFPVGITPVTYIFADPSGNTVVCNFNVIVNAVDTLNPVVSGCPANIFEEVDFGSAGINVIWAEPTASDNSGVTSITSQTAAPGSFFPVGTTEVTYTFEDPTGNSDQCSFLVTVMEVDRVVPIPICSSDITRTIIAGESGKNVEWALPTVTDNSGTATIASSTYNSGDYFPLGVTEVRYTFADASGNSAECSWNVNIIELDPCSPDPCQNGAACVIVSETEFFCVCPDCYSGDVCQFVQNACDGNACANGGVCVGYPGTCDQYYCECPTCFTGPFCNIAVDACDNNQCLNGAACVPDVSCTSYTCECPQCFEGKFCQLVHNPCQDNLCSNGAVCNAVGGSCTDYTCSCSSCFTGAFCQVAKSACSPNPCENNALCSVTGETCLSYSCQCIGCFTGFNCETPIPDPCNTNPCQNGGVCSTVQGTCGAYTCTCAQGFNGVNCDAQDVNVNPCNSFPCENGGTCLTMDGDYYICLCRSGYTGINCNDPNPNNGITNLCQGAPCLNGAACRTSYNSLSAGESISYIPQYSCICQSGFTGANCQSNVLNNPPLDICNLNRPPCENGGVCSNAYHSYDQDVDYYCACPVGFIGHNCETASDSPCASNPCVNGAFCSAFNTYFICNCQSGFSGTTCGTVSSPDSTGPSISNCPGSFSLTVSGTDSAVATWQTPTATDPSGGVSVRYQSHTSGDSFNVGTTPVSYVFQDVFGNYAVCRFVINVLTVSPTDNVPPQIQNCPSNVVVFAGDSGTAVATWTPPTATDNSGAVPSVSSSRNPGATFGLGSTPVQYTFTDGSGNQAVCEFTVSVIPATTDNIPPTIMNCPSDINVNIPAGNFGSAGWTAPSAMDETSEVTLVSGPAVTSGFFALGTTEITYVFADAAGNEARCSFNIIVSSGEPVDNIPPIISGCPSTITRNVDSSVTQTAVSWVEPTATDDSGAAPSVDRTANPGSLFDVGTTLVRYTFTDGNGNSALCEFNVIVNQVTSPTDMIDPVISNCPSDITQILPSGTFASASWVAPTATDNSGGEVTVTGPTSSTGFFSLGTTEIVYTFTDPSGNMAICSFNVIVTRGGATDTTPPTISNCPNTITVTANPGATSAVATWTPPTATDNSGVTPTSSSTANPGQSFPVGSTTVAYTFMDGAGLTSTCSFAVVVNPGSVVDNVSPNVFNCPDTVSVVAPMGESFAIATWTEPTATDNSGVAPTLVRTAASGSSFGLGTTEVRYTWTDASGNAADCIFNVVVSSAAVDNIAPVISGCPADVTMSLTAGSFVFVQWTAPTATDNSGVAPTVVGPSTPSGFFSQGATPVEYRFTDGAGNEAICSFTVTIIGTDNTIPTISGCPGSQTVTAIGDATSAVATWTEPTATDAGGAVARTRSHVPGSSFNVGATNVIYTFTDPSGNAAECTFVITVISEPTDLPPTVVGCPQDINVIIGPLETEGVASWEEPTAVDVVNGESVTLAPSSQTASPGDSFSSGTTTVTYTFADAGGQEATCSFLVTLTPGENPCSSDPCPSGLSCFYAANQFICRSNRRKRDVSQDWCPCENNGTCLKTDENFGSVSCLCKPGFEGILCEKVSYFVEKEKEEYDEMKDLFIYEEKEPHNALETANSAMEWSLIAAMAMLLAVIAVLAVTICLISSSRTRSYSKRPDEVPIIH